MLGPLVFACFVAAAAAFEDSSLEKGSEELIKSLRKKLTEDNYDYSDDSAHRRAEPRGGAPDAGTLRAVTDTAEADAPLASSAELLYYLDERHLGPPTPTHAPAPSSDKYQRLKMRGAWRRAGGEDETLVRAEGSGGVSLLRLGAGQGPVPQVSLSRARRQYMHAKGAASSDEGDLRPPFANPYVDGV